MKIKKCPSDGSYTMRDTCRCRARTRSAHPPKFSERFAAYRRTAKLSLEKKA